MIYRYIYKFTETYIVRFTWICIDTQIYIDIQVYIDLCRYSDLQRSTEIYIDIQVYMGIQIYTDLYRYSGLQSFTLGSCTLPKRRQLQRYTLGVSTHLYISLSQAGGGMMQPGMTSMGSLMKQAIWRREARR